MKTPIQPSASRRDFFRLGALAGAGLLLEERAVPAAEPVPLAGKAPPQLKVTDIKTCVLKTGHTFVEVFTDAGLTGLGECSPMVRGTVFAELIDKAIKRHVVGENPFNVEKIWRAAYFGHYKLGPMGVWLNALAGVDVALWDLMGKALGVPCYMLLGGKVRDTVPLYASAMRQHRSPKDEAAHLAKWVEKGFKAVKIHPYEYWAFNQGRDDTLEVVREVRAALGPDIPLLVDVNNSYTVERAVAIGRKLEAFNVALFEEPIAAYDYAGYARLCAELEIAVGAGEQEYTHWQHKDLILQGQVDVIQPDIVKAGGFTEMRKIATIASVFNRPIRCHNTQPTIGTAAHWHFWISTPMCLAEQEYPAEDHALRERTPILTEPLPIKDGALAMPDKPGIGVELDRKVLKDLLE
ncbi:MAG: mandelate racemase/muconate lactonizing enzyme family protein [Verrucomicrobia bacterium]|nr:mandelate racemase/muconate lactonizing enzyme family protein [Verrucomicrobiota bacterium]